MTANKNKISHSLDDADCPRFRGALFKAHVSPDFQLTSNLEFFIINLPCVICTPIASPVGPILSIGRGRRNWMKKIWDRKSP